MKVYKTGSDLTPNFPPQGNNQSREEMLRKMEEETKLDDALDNTFPASDPVTSFKEDEQ